MIIIMYILVFITLSSCPQNCQQIDSVYIHVCHNQLYTTVILKCVTNKLVASFLFPVRKAHNNYRAPTNNNNKLKIH